MSTAPLELQFTHPLPYGAILHDGGVQFVIFSRWATGMRVLLYDRVSDRDPAEILHFHPDTDRWGDIWSLFVPGLSAGQLYHLQADGPFEPAHGHRFDGNARLIDPYARALAGNFLPADDGIIRPPKCVVIDDSFDWQGDRHLKRNLSDTVIYELHVRGFTRSRTSGVDHPGTYLGVIEKIPYLQSLGVTAVELMPVHEYPINNCWGRPEPHRNYWGYDPLAFFAPHRGYAASREPGAQVREFKEMVRALHQAGIEVILDVVFNHTAEGNEQGPTLSFKGLANRIYYMLEAWDLSRYRNYSGCGNTVNGNHPIVREMIFLCLRHFVLNYHVDGFRFDLASILSRDRNGELVPNPPLVETIGEDPLLSDTKIIAEAWDAAGAYQVGSFATRRWAEWNGRYRDDVRRFWRGDPGMVGPLATRLAGSSDLYQASGRLPYHSINFITSHDGFPLNDLVSYNHKHNDANGEDNRDGDNQNNSYNYGVEGPTRRRNVDRVRQRQLKNMLATLLLSNGVPMILAGDECRRTQQGNNNAYCQDNAISWFDWRLVESHADMVRFCQGLIAVRMDQPGLRRMNFLTGHPVVGSLPDVAWYSPSGHTIDWHTAINSLTCFLSATTPESNHQYTRGSRHLLLFMHAGTAPQTFLMPPDLKHFDWRLFLDTSANSPRDLYVGLDGPPLEPGPIQLPGRTFVGYAAVPTPAAPLVRAD
ncbi:MAG: glycogen debranching protein GlgX [Pirellulales bacterium]